MSDILQNINASLDNSQNKVYKDFSYYLFNYMLYDWLHIPAVKFSTIDQERKKKKKVNYNENCIKKNHKTVTTLHK